MGKPAKPKSRHLPKSTACDFATTATDSAQSLIKNRLVENSYDGAFVRVRFSASAFVICGRRHNNESEIRLFFTNYTPRVLLQFDVICDNPTDSPFAAWRSLTRCKTS